MKRLRAFFSVLEHTAPGFLSFEVEKSDDFDGFCEKQLLEKRLREQYEDNRRVSLEIRSAKPKLQFQVVL